jgi:hypothetical protein
VLRGETLGGRSGEETARISEKAKVETAKGDFGEGESGDGKTLGGRCGG